MHEGRQVIPDALVVSLSSSSLLLATVLSWRANRARLFSPGIIRPEPDSIFSTAHKTARDNLFRFL
ncbi:MAG TPA: hypothetical protein ENH43_03065 [Phycisphaerales bacterium]|nr:hypothetical protein [Phycisphaerales bacterium]